MYKRNKLKKRRLKRIAKLRKDLHKIKNHVKKHPEDDFSLNGKCYLIKLEKKYRKKEKNKL
jgi:hypothetical protein